MKTDNIYWQYRKTGEGALSGIGAGLACCMVLLIRCYQATHYVRRPSCRFYPSCSEYVATGLARHGVLKGLLLGVKRIAKCHPWHCGGVDEVPG